MTELTPLPSSMALSTVRGQGQTERIGRPRIVLTAGEVEVVETDITLLDNVRVQFVHPLGRTCVHGLVQWVVYQFRTPLPYAVGVPELLAISPGPPPQLIDVFHAHGA